MHDYEASGRKAFDDGLSNAVSLEVLNANGPSIGSSLKEAKAWLKGWQSAHLEKMMSA